MGTDDGDIHVAFIKGNTSVPKKGMSIKGQISIPRLELNAARDLAEDVLKIETELDIPNLQPTVYYTDSLDTLAWIQNESPKETPKRYVMSRITYIRKVSKPSQWHYIPPAISLYSRVPNKSATRNK